MVKRTGLLIAILLAIVLVYPSSTSEKGEKETFVPKDMGRAVAMGCAIFGDKGPPPYAEVKVFVKYLNSSKTWDFSPVVARRGSILEAIEDCNQWYRDAEKAFKEELKGKKP